MKAEFNALSFDPDLWSDDPVLLSYANCYTYAVGDADLVGLQMKGASNPGCFSREENLLQRMTIEEVVKAATADGLFFAGQNIVHQKNCYPVALFHTRLYQTPDYHWLRMDEDGTWSHKHYEQEPRQLRNELGQPIRDVSHSVFQFFQDGRATREYGFVGYFSVPRYLSVDCDRVNNGMTKMSMAVGAGEEIKKGVGDPEPFDVFYERLSPKREGLIQRMASASVIVPCA